jgi:hypothetical protein
VLTDRELERLKPYFDVGHQGDVDVPQIRRSLQMTPTDRLRKHERWRLFVKETLQRAGLRRTDDRCSRRG